MNEFEDMLKTIAQPITEQYVVGLKDGALWALKRIRTKLGNAPGWKYIQDEIDKLEK